MRGYADVQMIIIF